MGLLKCHGSDRTVAADYIALKVDRLFHLEEVHVWESSLQLVDDIWHYTTSWNISGKNWMLVAFLVNIERWISPKLIGIWHFGASANCPIVRIVIKFSGLSHIWTAPLPRDGIICLSSKTRGSPVFHSRVQHVCWCGLRHGHRQACTSLDASSGKGADVGWWGSRRWARGLWYWLVRSF